MICALNKMPLAGMPKCTPCLKDAHSRDSLFQIQFIQQSPSDVVHVVGWVL
ncbi:MAG: hypothetical protein G5700_06610, partial [Serratia symbiotica]|nr:hypothetical protein [Serratia symbiotica]